MFHFRNFFFFFVHFFFPVIRFSTAKRASRERLFTRCHRGTTEIFLPQTRTLTSWSFILLWVQSYITHYNHLSPNTIKMGVNILSINARGLNHHAKRASLWKESKLHKSDILCIQETHFHLHHPSLCTHKAYPHIYQSSIPSKKRDVMIAIKDTVAFTIHDKFVVPEGHFIILISNINYTKFTLVNMYAPNTHQICFLNSLLKKSKKNWNSDPYWFVGTPMPQQIHNWIQLLWTSSICHHWTRSSWTMIYMTFGAAIMPMNGIIPFFSARHC